MPFEGADARFASGSGATEPVNAEAEQSLLGGLLINNGVYPSIAERLRPEHFGIEVHGRIFEACGRLIERGVPANAITLKNRFDQDAALTALGGISYLASLITSAATVVNAPHYADTIIDLWRRRRLIDLATGIEQRARFADIADPATTVAEAAGAALDALLSDSGAGQAPGAITGLHGAGVAAREALERASNAYRGIGTAGTVPSGIEPLDRLTGGFQNGDLIYIGKRPSMGGTAFAVTVALNAARAGYRVALWSAEMGRARIGHRMLAWLTGISTRAQRTGAIDADGWQAMANAQAELDALPLLIDDTAPVGVATIRRRARQARARGGLHLILVDYLQLIRAGDGHEDIPLRDAVPKVSGGLRDLAKELDVPVVCLAQLKPEIDTRENKRPILSDIRWSSDTEQDAGMVAMIYRDEYYLESAEPKSSQHTDPLKLDRVHAEWATALAASRGKAEILIQKAREDVRGTAHCGFDPVRSYFGDSPDQQGRFW